MPLHVRTKGITLSEANKNHIESIVETFKKFNLELTKIYVNIAKEKNNIHVEIEVDVAKASAVVINQSDEKLEVALDIAAQRVEKALRRLHDKLVSPAHKSIKDLEVEE